MLLGIGLATVVVLGEASCTTPTPTPATGAGQISILNNTTVAVSVVVNGTIAATVPAGGFDLPIRANLPARPWTFEAHSPTGRLLLSLTVDATDVISGTASVGNAAFLACGDLVVWAGAVPPDFPRPSQASLPPCA